jgi:hypothetical protein
MSMLFLFLIKRAPGFIMVLIILGTITAATAIAEENHNDKTHLQMGNISIDAVKKEIHIKTRLAIKHGILEFLLVDNSGKTYESALKIDSCKPSDLHTAILLLGIEPVQWSAFIDAINNKTTAQEFITAFPYCALTIEINHQGTSTGINQLIKSREKDEIENVWVFTGSFFTGDQHYAADLKHSYISVWPDESAVINIYSTHGNPYQGRFGFRMHGQHPWQVDEALKIVIRPYEQKEKANGGSSLDETSMED